MDHIALHDWRLKYNYSQSACAKNLTVDLKTWKRWEQGETPIPDHVVAWVEQMTAELDARAAGRRPPSGVPPTTAARIAHAKLTMDKYFKSFVGCGPRTPSGWRDNATPDAPYAFVASFWTSGICRWPFYTFGVRGTYPEPAALKACLDKIHAWMLQGYPWKQLALCPDCPADVRRIAELDPRVTVSDVIDPHDPAFRTASTNPADYRAGYTSTMPQMPDDPLDVDDLYARTMSDEA